MSDQMIDIHVQYQNITSSFKFASICLSPDRTWIMYVRNCICLYWLSSIKITVVWYCIGMYRLLYGRPIQNTKKPSEYEEVRRFPSKHNTVLRPSYFCNVNQYVSKDGLHIGTVTKLFILQIDGHIPCIGVCCVSLWYTGLFRSEDFFRYLDNVTIAGVTAKQPWIYG